MVPASITDFDWLNRNLHAHFLRNLFTSGSDSALCHSELGPDLGIRHVWICHEAVDNVTLTRREPSLDFGIP